MLFSLIESLDKLDIILASASPRRFELLKSLGLKFEVKVSGIAESSDKNLSAREHVLENARLKGQAVAQQYPDCLVISADTVVVADNRILEKPQDEQDAVEMLQTLSAKTHQVFTGFGLFYLRYKKFTLDAVCTDVTFRDLSSEEIWAYVNTGEPFDKAGAYAIQGQGALLVEKIDGCFFNVVGFPLPRFYKALDKFLAQFVI